MNFFNKNIIKKNLLRVALLVLLGRFLGILQDKFFMIFFKSASTETDIFFIATRIPSFFRQILGEKLLAFTLTPMIVTFLKTEGRPRALRLLTLFLILTSLGAIFIVMIGSKWPINFMYFFAPGFKNHESNLIREYLPIMIWYVFFISICEIISIGLRSANHFTIPALSPAIYHVTVILVTIVAITLKLPSKILAYSICIGGIVEICVRFFTFKKINLYFLLPIKNTFNDAKIVFINMLPMFFGFSIAQTHMLTEGIIGSFLQPGEITLLHYIYRLYHVPLMFFLIPLSTVLLPYLTRLTLDSKKKASFIFFEICKSLIWLIFPLSLLMIILSKDIVQFIHSSNITQNQTNLSAIGLSILSISIISTSLQTIFNSLFFAEKNTFYPTLVQAITTLINIAGCIISIKTIGFSGITLSTTLSSFTAVPLLIYLANQNNYLNLTSKKKLIDFLITLITKSTNFTLLIITIITFLKPETFLSSSVIWGYKFIAGICAIITMTAPMFKNKQTPTRFFFWKK